MIQTVLLVENHEDDVFLIQRAFKGFKSTTNLQVAEDGVVAMEYLSGAHKYADRTLYPLPSLVLMDIKMPRATGLEVLAWMKNEEQVKMIPVVIVSASEQEADIKQAYELGVNAYLTKPVQFSNLERTFAMATQFYTGFAAHPVLQEC